MEKVYAFQYCSCIYESSFYTVSLHRTQKSAELAMEFHKNEALEEFNEVYDNEIIKEFGFKFGENEEWCVTEIKIQE